VRLSTRLIGVFVFGIFYANPHSGVLNVFATEASYSTDAISASIFYPTIDKYAQLIDGVRPPHIRSDCGAYVDTFPRSDGEISEHRTWFFDRWREKGISRHSVDARNISDNFSSSIAAVGEPEMNLNLIAVLSIDRRPVPHNGLHKQARPMRGDEFFARKLDLVSALRSEALSGIPKGIGEQSYDKPSYRSEESIVSVNESDSTKGLQSSYADEASDVKATIFGIIGWIVGSCIMYAFLKQCRVFICGRIKYKDAE
jgi:hypothetical protein